MSDENDEATEEQLEALQEFIVERLNAGKTEAQIVAELTEDGDLDPDETAAAVSTFVAAIRQNARQERISSNKLISAMAGGLIAAFMSAWVWARIIEWTEYEVGYVALGVGFLVGMGVAIFSGGARGLPLQLMAAAWSGVGILLGKYWGVQALAKVEVPFGVFWKLYLEHMSPYDFLWYGLAFYISWSMLKGTGLDDA